MTAENLLSRISIDLNICFGKPCIKAHRIWVSLILGYLANDTTIRELKWRKIVGFSVAPLQFYRGGCK